MNTAGDVASFGGLSSDSAYRIAILDPFSPRNLACVVELVGSITTSGTCERGERLIGPHSGRPATRVAPASVCGPDLSSVDALATATAIAVGGEPGLAIVESIEDDKALVISFDGTRRWTEHVPFASRDAAGAVTLQGNTL